MDIHKNARLTLRRREDLVQHVAGGWPTQARCPISRVPGEKWGPVTTPVRIRERTLLGKITYSGLGPTFAKIGQTWGTLGLRLNIPFQVRK